MPFATSDVTAVNLWCAEMHLMGPSKTIRPMAPKCIDRDQLGHFSGWGSWLRTSCVSPRVLRIRTEQCVQSVLPIPIRKPA